MNRVAIPELRPWHRRFAARASPVAAFERLYSDEPFAFLYESLEAHGGQGRYSFIGARPRLIFRSKGEAIRIQFGENVVNTTGDPLEALRKLIEVQPDAPPIVPFCGGAVGYFGYDIVRWCETLPDESPDDLGLPDALFLFPTEVIAFDHLEKVVYIVLYQKENHQQRAAELEAAVAQCAAAAEPAVRDADYDASAAIESNTTKAEFCGFVEKAKEYIHAGDVFQVVLSQRFGFPVRTPPLDLYKALRRTNPSPYMYYLKLDQMQILGSSPEVLVKLTGRRAVTRPLAGTRRRGRNREEDEALERELKSDPKERAEHVMLVDLGRNDLGRVCEHGSVKLTDVLEIERHSKVMHLVSNVEGWLKEGCDAFDLFRAVFPAGTVSGAPKVRAMEIIEQLEPVRRGVYAGAIGYFSHLGDMDLCIAIRTMVINNGRGYIQAGAGIVADSVPELEYQETLNKARALMNAVALAEQSRRDP